MDAAIELLTARGADTLPHPGGTLLAHLRRVYDTLRSWHVPDAVALAGLTHAAYGTDGFPEPLLALTERSVLREAIGTDAERIVYAYGGCDRDTVYPRLGEPAPVFRDRFTGEDHRLDDADLRAFANITAANEIDVATHNADILREHGAALRGLFERMRPHLDDPAWQACAATFGPPRLRIDHLVLTVRDVDATVRWYRDVLGMTEVTFGEGRRAVAFGTQKINLHPYGRPHAPRAANPTPGSADFCLISETPLPDVIAHLNRVGVPIELGPVDRAGAVGPLTSVYLRDPDDNLVEISNYR